MIIRNPRENTYRMPQESNKATNPSMTTSLQGQRSFTSTHAIKDEIKSLQENIEKSLGQIHHKINNIEGKV